MNSSKEALARQIVSLIHKAPIQDGEANYLSDGEVLDVVYKICTDVLAQEYIRAKQGKEAESEFISNT
jgi:hypothetical protein|tara:strand:- start:98 stop:301 length:204 start_codon:yes stop_codon:yes gene_type:complete